MTLIHKPYVNSRLGNGHSGAQQTAGAHHACLDEVGMGRQPDFVGKNAHQIKGTQVNSSGQLIKGEILGKAGVDQFTHSHDRIRFIARAARRGRIVCIAHDQGCKCNQQPGLVFHS